MKYYKFIGILAICILFSGCEEENKTPAINIVYPTFNKKDQQQGVIMPITVEFYDPDGRITKAILYIDDQARETINFPSNTVPNDATFYWATIEEAFGSHIIKCEVFDNSGASDFDTISVFLYELEITPQAPEALFIANNVSIKEGDEVRFSDLSTGQPTSWRWVFEGGEPDTSSAQYPIVLYDSAGIYSVSLTVTNSVGSDKLTKIRYIDVAEVKILKADFSTSLPTILKGQSFSFIDNSTYSPASWSWDFGDGNTSTSQNPIHTYTEHGIFTVSLTVTYYRESRTIQKTINVINAETITDYEGNYYTTVQIGNQWWMADNLASTKYADGTAIPRISDNKYWSELSYNLAEKAHCWYGNDKSNKAPYGALYTWAAATNGSEIEGAQGVCPTGWHLPSDEDWNILEMELGMERNQANNTYERGEGVATKLKTSYDWQDNEYYTGTDLVGFSALPGGYRDGAGLYNKKGERGYWWSSTQSEFGQVYTRILKRNNPEVTRGEAVKSIGYSVRCVKRDKI